MQTEIECSLLELIRGATRLLEKRELRAVYTTRHEETSSHTLYIIRVLCLWNGLLYTGWLRDKWKVYSLLEHIFGTACPNFTKFSVYVSHGPGLVLSGRHCDTLCTFGLVDGVIFSHNGPYFAEERSRV